MSFAKRMSRQSTTSRANQLDCDRQKVQKWVLETAGELERECEQASRNASFSASIKVEYMTVLNSLQQLPRDWETLSQALQRGLKAHGFSKLTIKSVTWNKLSVRAEWDETSSEDSEDGPCSGGADCHRAGRVDTCGICDEDRSLVALAPCGHVLCKECGQQLRHRQCPFCRQPVQCATRGLFMD
ncbi:SSM4 [Symbiodinium natans]|uniref:SSM4 protein n=1 Tax=Symbiodinium natans TaxID=878477 RepID=A0A812S0J3_9DINO|nr:SSM4 [Symbiodinium natans]